MKMAMLGRFATRAALLSCGVLAAGACEDVSPVTYRPPARDADTADQANPEQVAACRGCLTGDAARCGAEYEVCRTGEPRCQALVECLTSSNCWRQIDLTNPAETPPCADRCFVEVNLTSINEIFTSLAPVYLCIIDARKCAPACLNPGQPGIVGADASTGS
jgi:hypothetical protein